MTEVKVEEVKVSDGSSVVAQGVAGGKGRSVPADVRMAMQKAAGEDMRARLAERGISVPKLRS